MSNIIIGFQGVQTTNSGSPDPKDPVCGKYPLAITVERRQPDQKQGRGGSNSQHPGVQGNFLEGRGGGHADEPWKACRSEPDR